MTSWSNQHGEEYRLMVREMKQWMMLSVSDVAVLRKATSGNLTPALADVIDYMFQKYLEYEVLE